MELKICTLRILEPPSVSGLNHAGEGTKGPWTLKMVGKGFGFGFCTKASG